MVPYNNFPNANLEKAMEFIANGQLIKAAQLTVAICKHQNEEFSKDAIVISMRVHILEKAILGGRISWEQENQSKSDLALKMLTLIEMMSSS